MDKQKLEFDWASNAWMRNKQKMKGGYYKYCCGYIRTNRKYCRRQPWYWKRSRNCYSLHYGEICGPGLCTYHEKCTNVCGRFKDSSP